MQRAEPRNARRLGLPQRAERLGIATSGEIARFFGLVTLEEARDWCAQPRGAAVPVTVGAANGAARRVLAAHGIEELVRGLPDPPPAGVLNPFDPLLRDRHRLSRLFAFDYRIEVFVPAPRRQWGYYVFPLLEGERLVGGST